MNWESHDSLTGESLDPDYGADGGGPCSLDVWTRNLGTHPPPERRPVPQWRLKELRAMPYREYLQSEEWQLTRWHVVYRAKGKCERCFFKASRFSIPLQVHHITYERLGDEKLSDLEALCETCHAEEHGFPA